MLRNSQQKNTKGETIMSNAKNVVKIDQMNELFQELLENFWSGDFSADEIPPVMLWGIGRAHV